MSKRPFSIFNITEEQAITMLETPSDQLEDAADRYVAAAQLVNYPGERAVKALIAAIQKPGTDLHDRITRRKAVESLGYLKAREALPILKQSLKDEDLYTVENAVWSIGEIGTQDPQILEEITQLLQQPQQNHRLIIHTLTQLAYQPAVEAIRPFIDSEDPPTSSAAISGVYQLTGDASLLPKIVEMLQHSSVNARRSSIQDLIDAKQYQSIPNIVQCPVSMVFRLRGVRLLAEKGIPAGDISFEEIEPALDTIIQDHPQDLELVHEYDQTPSLEFLLNELYETDFGRCYLAAKSLLEIYPDEAPEALVENYSQRARGDYGAHYHVVKVLGWFNYAPAYDIFIEALHNTQPQYQKSRTAAAIALGRLGDSRAIPEILTCLNTKMWSLQYACLIALHQLGQSLEGLIEKDSADFIVQGKYHRLSS